MGKALNNGHPISFLFSSHKILGSLGQSLAQVVSKIEVNIFRLSDFYLIFLILLNSTVYQISILFVASTDTLPRSTRKLCVGYLGGRTITWKLYRGWEVHYGVCPRVSLIQVWKYESEKVNFFAETRRNIFFV